VTLEPSGEPETSDFSPFLGNIQFNYSEDLKAQSAFSWGWDENEFRSWSIGGKYSSDDRRILRTQFRKQGHQNNLELDLSWPLGQRWQGRIEALLGEGEYNRVTVGYDACCWAIQLRIENPYGQLQSLDLLETLNPRHILDDFPDLPFNIMLTLRLKGLGEVSSGEIKGLTQGFSYSMPSLY